MAKAASASKTWSATAPVTPRAAMPSKSRARIFSMRAAERLAAMAWRSSSASAALKPAMATAISISCSWKSGTPSVRLRIGSSSGCR